MFAYKNEVGLHHVRLYFVTASRTRKEADLSLFPQYSDSVFAVSGFQKPEATYNCCTDWDTKSPHSMYRRIIMATQEIMAAGAIRRRVLHYAVGRTV